MEFIVLLCRDVLIEVLCYGTRYQLVRLEKVGKRFHQVVENYFGNVPFIRLNLNINPEIRDFYVLNQGISVIGKKQRKISSNQLAAFPQFLRFAEVKLCYQDDHTSILQRCHLIDSHLQLVSPILADASLVFCKQLLISDDRNSFKDHVQLLTYVGSQLLSICDSSCGYKFYIILLADENSAPIIISSLLIMPSIYASSVFKIHLCPGRVTTLPIDSISQWLNRNLHGIVSCKQSHKPRLLEIRMNEIQNIKEMCDHLEEV